MRMRNGDDREMLEPWSSVEAECDVQGIRQGRY